MDTTSKTAAIIVAAGRGTRMGGGMPKQWRMLAGQTVAARSIAVFTKHPNIDMVVVVLHPDDTKKDLGAVTKVTGGTGRTASVRAGLEALVGHDITKVLIHDVARPLVSAETISTVISALDHGPGAAPALPVTDALWTGVNDAVTGTQNRSGLYRAQTPQGFDFKTILAAHRDFSGDAADDVEIARAAGHTVAIVAGDERNLKLTYQEDFARAAAMLRETDMDIRVGTGFDVHRFEQGDHVVLCGVRVPHVRALSGHSDADVGMHALTDAIYGALAEGDIGQHFPPTDPQWKGAESHIFLRHAVELAVSRGYRISNVDVTLICEQPKIGSHSAAMRETLAQIMGMEVDRVSVKATTSERLGFTGREEGIAAQAVATLVSA